MLVLSRRQGQCIHFPQLDIAVKVVATKGASVRLGIEAPPHVTVLREELASSARPIPAVESKDSRDAHELRGQVHLLTMALHLAEKQLKAGMTADAEATLRKAQAVADQFSPPDDQAPRQRVQALLVEDNPNEEALLSSYLRMAGYQVETVHDGYEALEFLRGHERPDFLLLDMRLPRFDGPSTVAAIRGNPAYRGLTIFAVTGSSPSEFTLATGADGVDAWFQKPLNPRRIVEAMSAAARN